MMAQVGIHHNGHAITAQNIRHCPILVETHDFLSIEIGSSNEKAPGCPEPACLVQLPEGSPYGENIQITCLQEPDQSVLFISFCKLLHLIKGRPAKVGQAVQTASHQAALHTDITVLPALVPGPQFKGLCDGVGFKRMILIFFSFHLPAIIIAHLQYLSLQQIQGVLDGRMPWLHAKSGPAGSIDGCGITDCGQSKNQIRII